VAVLLTSRIQLMSALVKQRRLLRLETKYRIRVLGMEATIFRIRRIAA
jgi:hypothetical protein